MLKRAMSILSLTLGMTVISLGQSPVVSVAPERGMASDVDVALAAVGSGSVEQLKDRLFIFSIKFFNEEYRMQAMAAIPKAIREERIGQGKLLQRVERVFRQMLKLHGRAGEVELFLFHDDLPKAMLWRECILVISDGLADPLYDDELAGIISHELGHSYFVDEMAIAQQTRDAQAMRLVELKCDAVAILSLKLTGYRPTSYLKGLQRARTITKRMNLSRSGFKSHPDDAERALFAQRFIAVAAKNE